MKRVYQLVVVAVMLFVPVMMSQPALAQVDCEISETGSGSENECTVDQKFTCEVDNENKVTITDSNGQVAYSGSVSVSDNGEGGNSQSGSVTNSNDTTFNVTITNGETCEVAVTPTPEPPVTPETPETPEKPTPGRGGASAPVQPAQKVTPSALPVTSGGTAPIIFLAGSVVLTGALALAYRRLFE